MIDKFWCVFYASQCVVLEKMDVQFFRDNFSKFKHIFRHKICFQNLPTYQSSAHCHHW